MELRVLRYFLAIAREENITKASYALNITQPTLSRQIQQLEDELGVQLFTRKNHRVTLTEDGLLLKRRAQELIALEEKTKLDFTANRDAALAGELYIGSGDFFHIRQVAAAAGAFHRQHPLVQYRLYSGDSDNIKERIDRGILDLGILVEPTNEEIQRKYHTLPLPGCEQWGVLVPSDSPLAHKKTFTPKDLDGVPVITSSREPVQSKLAEWFFAERCRLVIAATGNLPYNKAMLSAAGIGITLCLRLRCSFDGLTFIPLEPPVSARLMLVWKKDAPLTKTTAAFITFAENYFDTRQDGASHA